MKSIEQDLITMALYSHGVKLRGPAINLWPLARKLRKIAEISERALGGADVACKSKKKRPKGR